METLNRFKSHGLMLLTLLLHFSPALAAIRVDETITTVIGTWTAVDANDGSTAYLAIVGLKESSGTTRSSVGSYFYGSFVDSLASAACADDERGSVPFLGTVISEEPVDVDKIEDRGDLEFKLLITGECQKKTADILIKSPVRYFGETDTVRFLGTEWTRYKRVLPADLEAGVEELRGSFGWVVADLISSAREKHLVNAICDSYANVNILWQAMGNEDTIANPDPNLVRSDHESNCSDGLDNDCNGAVDEEEPSCQTQSPF